MIDQAISPRTQARAKPHPGAVVQVPSWRYLVESVEPPTGTTWEQTLVDLSCLDDEAQGERLSVLWELKVDAGVLETSRLRTARDSRS